MTQARHIPWFGLSLAVVTIALAVATNIDHALHSQLQHHFALDWDAIEDLEFYRIALSPFVQTSPGFSPTVLGLTALAVPVFEAFAGTRRAVTTFFLGDWLSTLPILLILQVAGWLGSATAGRLSSAPDSGSSSGGFACMTAFCCSLPTPWRFTGLGALAGFFAVRIAFWHRLFDFQHAAAALIGAILWFALEARGRARRAALGC